MNAEAFRRIREPATVALLYDRQQNAIGIKLPVAADRNFFPVRRYGRGRKMRIVRAAWLLKQFGITITETIRIRPAPIYTCNGNPMLVMELEGLVSATRSIG